MYDPVVTTLVAKMAYALCGGIGALLAVSITPTTARAMLGRTVAGVGLCFLAAEPLCGWVGLVPNVHVIIGVNGLLGFLSWYLLHALDGAASTIGSKEVLLRLLVVYVPALREITKKPDDSDVTPNPKPNLRG